MSRLSAESLAVVSVAKQDPPRRSFPCSRGASRLLLRLFTFSLDVSFCAHGDYGRETHQSVLGGVDARGGMQVLCGSSVSLLSRRKG